MGVGEQKALNMLSLARRAGDLLIGQDNIFDALRGGRLFR